MSGFLLSASSVASFCALATSYGASIVEHNLELTLVTPQVQVRIFQPEAFPEYLNCHIVIQDCSLCLEDVWYALNGSEMPNTYTSNKPNHSDRTEKSATKKRNDDYVALLVNFCVKNNVQLLQWPPSWFPAASAHAAQQTARHFPDIAKQELADRTKLWNAWNGASPSGASEENCGQARG